jgi:hypothetical protein
MSVGADRPLENFSRIHGRLLHRKFGLTEWARGQVLDIFAVKCIYEVEKISTGLYATTPRLSTLSSTWFWLDSKYAIHISGLSVCSKPLDS